MVGCWTNTEVVPTHKCYAVLATACCASTDPYAPPAHHVPAHHVPAHHVVVFCLITLNQEIVQSGCVFDAVSIPCGYVQVHEFSMLVLWPVRGTCLGT